MYNIYVSVREVISFRIKVIRNKTSMRTTHSSCDRFDRIPNCPNIKQQRNTTVAKTLQSQKKPKDPRPRTSARTRTSWSDLLCMHWIPLKSKSFKWKSKREIREKSNVHMRRSKFFKVWVHLHLPLLWAQYITLM